MFNRSAMTCPMQLLLAGILSTLTSCGGDPTSTLTPANDSQTEREATVPAELQIATAAAAAEERSNPQFISRASAQPVFDGFAILAKDPITGDFGAAVLSKSPLAGSVAIEARAGVGAVATLGNVGGARRDRAIDLLQTNLNGQPMPASQVVDTMLKADDKLRRSCMLAVLDAEGRSAYQESSQGNCGALQAHGVFVVAHGVTAFGRIPNICEGWKETEGLPLDERLFHALGLAAAYGNEGARRWQPRSAAVLIVRPKGGAFGRSDRLIDLRVDYHGAPVERLGELLQVTRRGFIVPRLLQMQKLLDTGSPLHKRNSAWIRRVRRRNPLGSKD